MKRQFLLALFLITILSCASFCVGFSFAVFGDNRDGEKVFNDMLSLIKMDSDIQFAVNTGDITPSGTKAEYNAYWADTDKANIKIFDVLGNHDIGTFGGGQEMFKKRYGQTYYYFDRDGYRFIMIDNSKSRGLGSAQWAWLRKALETHKKLFVFMHMPLFDISGNYPKHVMYPKSENEELKRLLEKNKARYIFAGHIHGYGREVQGSIVYVITGGAGAPLYLPHFNGGFYHYVKVTVDGDNIKDEMVKVYND